MMTEIQDTDLKSNNIHENRCFWLAENKSIFLVIWVQISNSMVAVKFHLSSFNLWISNNMQFSINKHLQNFWKTKNCNFVGFEKFTCA